MVPRRDPPGVGQAVRAVGTDQRTGTGAHERDEAVDVATRPDGIDVVHAPLEDAEDAEFVERWGFQLASPHYYGDALERFADRSAAMVRAVARARPGGVLVHCVIGRDRTGQAALVLLTLAGVAPDDIAADHALSYDRCRPIDPHPEMVDALPDDWLTDHQGALRELVATLDVEDHLRTAGVNDVDLAAVRARLVDGAPA